MCGGDSDQNLHPGLGRLWVEGLRASRVVGFLQRGCEGPQGADRVSGWGAAGALGGGDALVRLHGPACAGNREMLGRRGGGRKGAAV